MISTLSAILVLGLPFGFEEPESQAYSWKNVEIVGGGFVTGIEFHPRQKDLIYARTDIGGIYRWNPKTARWIPLHDFVQRKDWTLYGAESVAMDPTDPRKLYLAAGMYSNHWSGNASILRSNDQGSTWQRTNMPFKMGGNEDGRSMGERLAVDPNLGSKLLFGSRHNGLWESLDGGATWAQSQSFPIQSRTNGIGIGFVLFDAASGARGKQTPTIYASAGLKQTPIYRSQDGGESWHLLPGQPLGYLPHHAELSPDGTLYVTYGDAPGPNGMADGAVWKMKDGVWTEITPVKPGPGNGFGYAGLALDASNPNVVMVSSMDKWSTKDEIWRSLDGGKTWKGLSPKSHRDSSTSRFLDWGRGEAEFGHWIGDVEIDPHNPDRAMYVTGATIWGTGNLRAADKEETTHWKVRAEGLEETAVICLISPPKGAHLISGLGDIGGFRHDDFGKSPAAGMWTNPTISSTDSLDFAESKPNLMTRTGRGGAPVSAGLSKDGGKTWTPFKSPGGSLRGGGVAAISSDGETIVWSPEGGSPCVSRDGALTWTEVKSLPAGARPVADRVDPNRFYAYMARGNEIWASSDRGATFLPVATIQSTGSVLKAVPGKVGHLWLPTDNGFARSIDGGKTFVRVPSIQSAESVGFGKAAPGAGYPSIYLLGVVQHRQGIYRSDDEGRSWVKINSDAQGFGTMQVIVGDPRIHGRAYLGTNGRGVLVGNPK